MRYCVFGFIHSTSCPRSSLFFSRWTSHVRPDRFSVPRLPVFWLLKTCTWIRLLKRLSKALVPPGHRRLFISVIQCVAASWLIQSPVFQLIAWHILEFHLSSLFCALLLLLLFVFPWGTSSHCVLCAIRHHNQNKINSLILLYICVP